MTLRAKEIVDPISRKVVLELIESRPDSPGLSWTPESFMSFLGYLKEEIEKL